jgi:hAT family C-terminal dimerisation region
MAPLRTSAAVNVSDHYRPQYFELIDTATSELATRFNDSIGLQTYSKLEEILVTGKINEAVLEPYIDIDDTDFALQLAMFRRRYVIISVSSAADSLRNMSTDMRSMFSEVEKFVRLLMVCPCSSATAERSFSALRRLKTWLRSSMSQSRLNNVAVCHCHQDLLDDFDVDPLIKEFVCRSDVRINLFGNLKDYRGVIFLVYTDFQNNLYSH